MSAVLQDAEEKTYTTGSLSFAAFDFTSCSWKFPSEIFKKMKFMQESKELHKPQANMVWLEHMSSRMLETSVCLHCVDFSTFIMDLCLAGPWKLQVCPLHRCFSCIYIFQCHNFKNQTSVGENLLRTRTSIRLEHAFFLPKTLPLVSICLLMFDDSLQQRLKWLNVL